MIEAIGSLAPADEVKTVESWMREVDAGKLLQKELVPVLRPPWAGWAWEWLGVSGPLASSAPALLRNDSVWVGTGSRRLRRMFSLLT